MPGKRPDDIPENQWRSASLALTIPTMLAAGPLVGYFLGWGATRLFSLTDPWDSRARIVGVLVGTVAGIHETVKIIRRISSES